MINQIKKLPYPWFGGKRKVASIIWDRLGDVENYVEPFYGGGAVHLLRPAGHAAKIETINDMDGFVANFWRALKDSPRSLAEQIDWPVNEIDLEARHRSLCKMPDKLEFLQRIKHEPDYYDLKRAAWWCWGLCAWIGAGWCGGEYYPADDEQSRGRGVCAGANKLPRLSRSIGVHRQLPHLGNAGMGVHRQLPHLGDAGRGVHRKRHQIDGLLEYIQALADRLRDTRVCCGDWQRVCTRGATTHGKTVGVFLDPPYSGDAGRDNEIYRCEDLSVSDDVRQWCEEKTHDQRFKIVLAGYEGEHHALEENGWDVISWKAQGGFANFGEQKQGKENAKRERLWISPSCRSGDGTFDFMNEKKAG